MNALVTERLELLPITLPIVEAVFLDRRDEVSRLAGASLPEAWPGRALVERAFAASLDAVREDPHTRLWGDRLMITRGAQRRIVGSVVFHGRCDVHGSVELAYGVEPTAQGRGYATEATIAAVQWAFEQTEVRRVKATTFPWHKASIRVLEKIGMRVIEVQEHDYLGEQLVYAVDRGSRRGV